MIICRSATILKIIRFRRYSAKGLFKNLVWRKRRTYRPDISAHTNNLFVYADLVFNHNSGGDEEEVNPIDNKKRWTSFKPKSGKFFRDWTHFHPSEYETMDDLVFGNFLEKNSINHCHRPSVQGKISYQRTCKH